MISQYGVTDLAGLAATTHRFESRYLDRLVGVLPATPTATGSVHRRRTPRRCAPRCSCSTAATTVVPVEQAGALVAAVRAAGGTVDAHVYDGEGHGWSRPATIEDVYRRVDAFLRRHVVDA